MRTRRNFFFSWITHTVGQLTHHSQSRAVCHSDARVYNIIVGPRLRAYTHTHTLAHTHGVHIYAHKYKRTCTRKNGYYVWWKSSLIPFHWKRLWKTRLRIRTALPRAVVNGEHTKHTTSLMFRQNERAHWPIWRFGKMKIVKITLRKLLKSGTVLSRNTQFVHWTEFRFDM